MDLLVWGALAILTPEIAQELIRNISNRWARVLIRSLLPLTRLMTLVRLWISIGFTGIQGIKWLNPRIIPYIEKLLKFVTYSVNDGRFVFLELFIKCLLVAFFAGGLCRVLCEYSFKNTRKSVTMALVQIGGIYYLFTTAACFKLAQILLKNSVIIFFVHSQLSRWAVILGSLRILLVVERTPYVGCCFFVVIYMFRLFACASTATPNLF